jgi:hypothetical protein
VAQYIGLQPWSRRLQVNITRVSRGSARTHAPRGVSRRCAGSPTSIDGPAARRATARCGRRQRRLLIVETSTIFTTCLAERPGLFVKAIVQLESRRKCLGPFVDKNNGAITALAGVVVAIFTLTLWWSTRTQFKHVREVERAYGLPSRQLQWSARCRQTMDGRSGLQEPRRPRRYLDQQSTGAPDRGRVLRTIARVRAHALWGLTQAELFPSPTLSRSYPRTPGLRPRPGRAAAMELASPFSGFNGPCGTADLAACERHMATTSGELLRRAPRYAPARDNLISPVLAGNRAACYGPARANSSR